MTVLEALAAALFLSMAVNRVLEALVAPVKKKYPGIDLWWFMYVAWVAAGGLAFAAHIDLVTPLVPTLQAPVGVVLTALVVGGGAELIHSVFPSSSPVA